ncbi:hypothetical protein MRX96_037353 [Rhipicephalus microplus]
MEPRATSGAWTGRACVRSAWLSSKTPFQKELRNIERPRTDVIHDSPQRLGDDHSVSSPASIRAIGRCHRYGGWRRRSDKAPVVPPYRMEILFPRFQHELFRRIEPLRCPRTRGRRARGTPPRHELGAALIILPGRAATRTAALTPIPHQHRSTRLECVPFLVSKRRYGTGRRATQKSSPRLGSCFGNSTGVSSSKLDDRSLLRQPPPEEQVVVVAGVIRRESRSGSEKDPSGAAASLQGFRATGAGSHAAIPANRFGARANGDCLAVEGFSPDTTLTNIRCLTAAAHPNSCHFARSIADTYYPHARNPEKGGGAV